MKPEKLVSIIIPCYNCEDLLVKALDSIPDRDDVEVICINDCSTDKTLTILNGYNRIPLIIKNTEENIGCGGAKNIGYDVASGEWIWSIDSDDYYLTDKANLFIDTLKNNPNDLVYINCEVNNKDIWAGDKAAAWGYAMRRSLLGDYRCPIQRRGADWCLWNKLIKDKNPKVSFSNICCYHYNYPRKDSITWKYENGLTDQYGKELHK